MGGPSRPGVVLVTIFPVNDVWWSGWATSPSERCGLTRRPLRSIRGHGVATSLSLQGHVHLPPFNWGLSPFLGYLLSWAEWAPLGCDRTFPAGVEGSGEAEPSSGGRWSGEAEPSNEVWVVSSMLGRPRPLGLDSRLLFPWPRLGRDLDG